MSEFAQVPKRSRGRPRKSKSWSEAEPSKQEQYERRRFALLKTAARQFSEKGYYATSVDTLAGLLNVTKPTLYHYVKDKDEILFECHKLAFEMMGPAIEACNKSDASGLQKLRVFLPHWTRMVASEFGTCLLRTGLVAVKPKNRRILEDYASKLDDTVMDIITLGIKDGSIRPCNPRLAAYAIISGYNGLATWYQDTGELSLEEISELFSDIYFDGLSARNQDAPEPQ